MSANAGLPVIVADPAYASRWGSQHWLAPLREHHPETTGHHAAALVPRGGPAERIRPSAIRLALWPKDRCPQAPGTVH